MKITCCQKEVIKTPFGDITDTMLIMQTKTLCQWFRDSVLDKKVESY